MAVQSALRVQSAPTRVERSREHGELRVQCVPSRSWCGPHPFHFIATSFSLFVAPCSFIGLGGHLFLSLKRSHLDGDVSTVHNSAATLSKNSLLPLTRSHLPRAPLYLVIRRVVRGLVMHRCRLLVFRISNPSSTRTCASARSVRSDGE